jgi:hypothetical protein
VAGQDSTPLVRLGETDANGIAPAIYALLERGAERRPELVGEMSGLAEIRFAEDFSPVRVAFTGDEVLVEDGSWDDPHLVVAGRLPDVVALTTAKQVGGVPNPTARSGRAALSQLARQQVKITGSIKLGRQLLQLLRL